MNLLIKEILPRNNIMKQFFILNNISIDKEKGRFRDLFGIITQISVNDLGVLNLHFSSQTVYGSRRRK